jgi:N-acetyl-anhydromuramyl-L-alanine amidase AmpD
MIAQRLQTKNTSGLGNTKEYIVLHHTGTGESSLQWVLRTFQSGPVSAHYVIDTDGSIYAFNTDDDILRHAWPSTRDGKTNLNQYSIGIEVIGPLPWFTDAQRRSLRVLVTDLMHKYHIPSTHLIRHKDIAPRRKVDPDDSLWAIAFPSYESYQQSYTAVQAMLGFYEQVYQREFADQIARWDVVIQDIAGVVQRVTNADGSININELVYFIGIGLERVYTSLQKKAVSS